MSYELAHVEYNPIRLESWERIGKFVISSFFIGIVTSILIGLILTLFIGVSIPLSIILVIATVITTQVIMLSWYERWRGCHFKVSDGEGGETG
jgi:hypothetical protein